MSYGTLSGWSPTNFFKNDYGDFTAAYLAQRSTLLRVAGQRPEPGPNNKALPWTSVARASEIVEYWKYETQRMDLLEHLYDLPRDAQDRALAAIRSFWSEYPKYFTSSAWDSKTGGPFLNYSSTVSFWDMISKLAIQLNASSVIPTSSQIWAESVLETLPRCFTNPAECLPNMPAWMKWATVGSLVVGAAMLLKKR